MSEMAHFNEFSDLDLFQEDAVAEYASHGGPLQDDRARNLHETGSVHSFAF